MRPVSPCGLSVQDRDPSVVAVIPARYHSTRLPGKALADIAGKPMIEHVYRRASAVPGIASVLVATDDHRIREAVERFGGDCRLTSPSHLSGTDRLAEVAGDLDCDLVVNVQGDEPLIEPAAIEEAIRPLASDATLVMSTLRRRMHDLSELEDPAVVKVVVDREGYALYFSRAAIPFSREPGPGAADRAWKHVGLYVYRRAFLLAYARLEPSPLERLEGLEQLRALEYGYRIKTVETVHDSIGVDTPADLDRVRRLAAATAPA